MSPSQPRGQREDSASSVDSSSAPAPKVRRTRISRACENCRARRIKCEPPYPCVGCREAGLSDCLVREKARPLRRRRSQQAAVAALEGSAYPERTRFWRTLEEELEGVYHAQTGKHINLSLEDMPSHPGCDLDTPLPPMLDPLPPNSAEAMQQFTEFILPFCSHLTAPRIMSLWDRFMTAQNTLTPDQLALMLISLALGYLRLQGFTPGGTAESGLPAGRAVPVPDEDRLDVPLFRHAVHVLEKWGSATFTSLHALCGIWYYTCLACSRDTTRLIVSWLVAQAKELGIEREDAAAQLYSPSDRADLMFIQVLYAHYWTTALSDHPPIIRPGEFERMSFRSRPINDDDAVVALVVRRSFTELLILNTQLMINLHDSRNSTLSIDWLLGVESKFASWCNTWVMDGRTTGNVYTDPFLGVLWDWGRMTLRLAARGDKRVAMASLSVLARSATQVIHRYGPIYRKLPVNLMHQHLVTMCAYVIILCFWRYEVTRTEAETSLGMAVWMISLMEPRWGHSAADSKIKVTRLAEAVGLDVNPSMPNVPLDQSSGVLPSQAMSEAEQFIDAHGALGSLYETFQNFNQTTANPGLSWTIDPLFLAAEYPQHQ